MVKKIVLSLIAVLSLTLGFAQNRQVTGTVTGEDGGPIIGAMVMVEGTHTGTTTDVNGRFAISAGADATLMVSFVGYETQRIPVAGQVRFTIVLKENLQRIDDVMVVAFGTTKKEAFTGSAAVVKAEDLQKRQTTNVMNALVGQVAGLQMRTSSGQPGSTGNMNVRGISSMYSTTTPLIIVDGAPFSASLSNIPQSDIESVTVLKDAASAALYGARGASGVILVTTKRGRSKNADITVDMKWGVNSRALQEYDVITDPGEYYEAYYAQLYNKRYYGDGMSADAAAADANAQMLKDLRYNVYTLPEGESLIVNGKLNPKATYGRKVNYNGKDYWLQGDNWTDEAFKTGLRQEYNVSLNGSADRASYYMSLGYLSDEGLISNSKYERISARVKADYQARKWLKVGANVAYTNSETSQNSNQGTDASSTSVFYFTSGIAPIYPVYVRTIGEDGKPHIAIDEYGNKAYDYGRSENAGLQRPFMGGGNPLGANAFDRRSSYGNQLNGTFTADADITKWLRLSATSTVIWGQTQGSDFNNMFYGPTASTRGDIGKSVTTTIRTNNVQTLAFHKTFCDAHNVNVMLGHEYYNTKTRYLYGHAKGMFSPDIPEIDAAATEDKAESYTSRYNVEGWFASAQYDYKGKYFLSGSYRRDASSYFHPDHRWGNFWSVGAAWLINKESFMANASWIDLLKLKFSIGQQGNDGIGSFAYVDMYSLSKSSDSSVAASFWRKGNPDITWETTTNMNVGLEFSLWGGRLNGNVDVYSKKTTDLLFWVSVPESSGTRGVYQNIGDMRNSGIEIELNGTLIRTKTVDWSLSANLSHNATKILKLPKTKIAKKGGFVDDNNGFTSYWYKEGGPMYNYYAPVYAGHDELGQAMYYVDVTDENGNVTGRTTTYEFNDATRYEHGSILPKVFGGFGTNLRVGNFDLSLTFDYQIGGKVIDLHYASLMTPAETSGNGGAIHKDWKRSWNPVDNTKSDLPRWQQGDRYTAANSDRWMTDASYLNFQSFTVGYTIPSKLLGGKVKMRVYAAGENLCFWSARQGLDPRYAFDGNTSVTGYSPMRTISGGVQLTF